MRNNFFVDVDVIATVVRTPLATAAPSASTSFPTTSFHATSFHATSFHATPFHATSFHATSFHATSFHATSFHATPFHATPFHATPFHATPFHATPFHITGQCYRLVSPGVALRTRKTSALTPSDDDSGHLIVSPPV